MSPFQRCHQSLVADAAAGPAAVLARASFAATLVVGIEFVCTGTCARPAAELVGPMGKSSRLSIWDTGTARFVIQQVERSTSLVFSETIEPVRWSPFLRCRTRFCVRAGIAHTNNSAPNSPRMSLRLGGRSDIGQGQFLRRRNIVVRHVTHSARDANSSRLVLFEMRSCGRIVVGL